MHRAFVPRHVTTTPPLAPPAPPHVGSPLQTGEICLLRKPGTWLDLAVQLRAVDRDLALVLINDRTEIVQLTWLRRTEIMR